MRRAPRYADAIIPLLLIAAGAVALLVNAHVLSAQAVENLGALWPVILIVIGIALVLRTLLPPATANAVSLVVAAATVVIALVVAIAAPAIVPVGTATVDSSAALGEGANASVSLDVGAYSIAMTGQDLGTHAYQAHVEYAKADGAPHIDFSKAQNALRIALGQSRPLPFFHTNTGTVTLTLSNHLPWRVTLGGGASDVHLTLGHLQLANLSINGGADSVDATLGAPKGTDRVDISGGASDVTVRLPKGSQWRVQVSGGASSVTVDGQDINTDNTASRESTGFASASDRYDIQISGGASSVTLDTNGSQS